MEGRICAEAAHSATRMGLTRSEANRIVKEILLKYEKDIPNAPIGKKFSECYDLEKVKPSKEYVELHERTKEEVKKTGFVYAF
jgi:methylamine--corrinoid protein Co-methyltransferase